MSKRRKLYNFKLSPPVITAVISVVCIITIICATIIIDKRSAVSPTDTPLDVTQTDTQVATEIEEVSSAAEVVDGNVTSSKPASSQESSPAKPFTPQGDMTPTDVSTKICYLTFDDGPSENTLKILDILKKYNVKATFFVMGAGKLEYTKRIVAEGHTIGLHCNNHDYSKVYASSTAYYNDLKAISDKVEKACGVRSNIIRFPGGSSNTASRSYCSGLMTKLTRELPQKGYYYFDWNVDSGDATGNNVAVSRIMSNIKGYRPRKDAVVLMHDTSAKDTTVKALPQIIEYYMSAGYYLAPLSQNSESAHHPVNN